MNIKISPRRKVRIFVLYFILSFFLVGHFATTYFEKNWVAIVFVFTMLNCYLFYLIKCPNCHESISMQTYMKHPAYTHGFLFSQECTNCGYDLDKVE